MREITADELQEILRKHELWLNGECGERADLSEADLAGAYLKEADLRDADLRDADLREADLREADLRDADLSGANLSEADLRSANLRGANLSAADLHGTNLRKAILKEAKDIPYIPLACPEEGSFICFKKAGANLLSRYPVIVKLLVLEDAKRSSATSNKCRCSKAKVLDIQDLDGNSIEGTAFSLYDKNFTYEVGKVVEVKDFDENRFNECTTGIHFFINREDAVDY